MIIAKPLKKTISIPLETFPSSVNGSVPCHQSSLPDAVTYSQRSGSDFADKVFGKDNMLNKMVEQVLDITTTRPAGPHYERRTLQCQACIYNDTVFLSSPFIGANANWVNWAPGEFQSCVTHFIELAEEKTGCSVLVVAIDKEDKNELNMVLRAFMYLGFEMLDPSLYRQQSRFILVGYEL